MDPVHDVASVENAAAILPGTCLERWRMFWRR